MYKLVIKSIFDFSISFVILIMMFPILFGATIIFFIANDGKPFFFQLRPGIDGKLFKIIKFKTMNDKKDTNGNLLPDVFRLTKMGQLVRKTSLDEIPQLLNVLKGDMSLVGPRPLLPDYLPLYNESQNRRHEVKPGITGWAQVNGRNSISWQQKFEYDIWYVDNMSFVFDCKILFLTISKVFKKEGISQRGRVTVDYFKGNE
jgi:undecaprenyl phosphate N,N'-diacetylbacillosamine 1-phosphate transferase